MQIPCQGFVGPFFGDLKGQTALAARGQVESGPWSSGVEKPYSTVRLRYKTPNTALPRPILTRLSICQPLVLEHCKTVKSPCRCIIVCYVIMQYMMFLLRLVHCSLVSYIVRKSLCCPLKALWKPIRSLDPPSVWVSEAI